MNKIKKEIKFIEAKNFISSSGYFFAVYQKGGDGNYHKIEDVFDETPIDDNTPILVDTIEDGSIHYKNFMTKDMTYKFKLHNNFNIPDIIPCLSEKEIEWLKKNKKPEKTTFNNDTNKKNINKLNLENNYGSYF
jgi:hypothetical protein